MKFVLISVILLLVPLALAKPTSSPTIKLVYHDGYVLTESHDPRLVQYTRPNGWSFLFESQDNRSVYVNTMELIIERIKESPSFVIESYYRGPNFDSGKSICKQNSTPKLQHLINRCLGNNLLRELNEEERAQIEQYKKEQKATRIPFEAIHREKRVITKSANVDAFSYQDTLEKSTNHNLKCWGRVDRKEYPHMVRIIDRLVSRSFTIQALPAERKEKCGKIDLEDLKLTECIGNIKVKPY